MEWFIALGIGAILLALLLASNTNWAKAHVPYSVRRWVSIDGFNEGKVKGFTDASEKIKKRSDK